MVEPKTIQKQLKKIGFGGGLWNQAEINELPNIIHEGEEVSECVSGFYEGGVALLVATEMRVLLIDKKPLRFLNVEDLRFDMINEIDYNHRLLGAAITISTGSKTLSFKSFNQERLRHLIGLVQEQMSKAKKDQSEQATTQQQHLEEINRQLQMYLMAQNSQLQQMAQGASTVDLPKPSPQLADYLFTQRLLEQFDKNTGQPAPDPKSSTADLLAEARKEIMGNRSQSPANPANTSVQNTAPLSPVAALSAPTAAVSGPSTEPAEGLEISPLQIACSKLPMMLRNRKFGRPSLRAHSQHPTMPTS